PSMYKRPLHFYMGFFRQFELKHANLRTLMYRYLKQSGHLPFEWVDPNGYPQDASYWYDGHMMRLQHSMKLGAQNDEQALWDDVTLFPDKSTAGSVMGQLNKLLFVGEMPVPEKIWINRLLRGKTINAKNLRGAVAVALGSP